MKARRNMLFEDVAMRALHRIAYVALRVQSPLRARETALRIGSRLPAFSGAEEARWALARLGRRGSCLSRSIAIASRLHNSRVVIGVDVRRSARFSAHAWVEFENEIVDSTPYALRGDRLASF